MRSVLANRPDLAIEQLTRTKELMNAAVRDCLVENYEGLIDALELPDPNDRHVLAAIYAEAEIIVTFNLRDFPAEKLRPFGVDAVHPDAFVMGLIENDAPAILLAVERQRQSLKNPPKTTEELLAALEANGLEETVRHLRESAETSF